MYHNSVLLRESIEGLGLIAGGKYVDVTFGGGGHSKEILKSKEVAHLYAFDQDADAEANLISDSRFSFIPQNFKYLKNFLRLNNAIPVDGILADLGVSSHQFDQKNRGFSIRFDSDLDMRMDQSISLTAQEIINTSSEQELIYIFSHYGEVRNTKTLVAKILEQRSICPIQTTENFIDSISSCIPGAGKRNKYLAQVFQALRICVNDEVTALKELLLQSVEVLKVGGRMVVISYHSLEDRLVKNFFKTGNLEGERKQDLYGNLALPFRQLHSKVLVPSEGEIANNNRARSAKLRIAERI